MSAATPAALTTALDALSFTPALTEVPVGQSVTTDATISVNDTVATGSDSATRIIAVAVGAPGGFNFISGSAGNDALTATAAPDVIAENLAPQGNDTISGFDVSQDMVQLSVASFADYSAVSAATSSVSGSAVIRIEAADPVTLLGVSPGSLTAANFRFV